jgi:hypothetical protein
MKGQWYTKEGRPCHPDMKGATQNPKIKQIFDIMTCHDGVTRAVRVINGVRIDPSLKDKKSDKYQYNDGGRADAGYKGDTGDCVTRAVAIASGKPYQEIYEVMAHGNATQRKTKQTRDSMTKRSARNGVYTQRKWFKDYMKSIGFKWTPTMLVGSGCKVHLKKDELPDGRLVAMVSKHCVAMIDGIINDLYDCSRDGTRCVYGYWRKE